MKDAHKDILKRQEINQAQNASTSDRDVTFFTISDARFFPGSVGLINSLRLTGHDNNVVVLDCGLTQSQRKILEPHCTLFEVPRELGGYAPYKYKAFPYMLHPKGTVAIIDSDILVTGALDPLIKLAQQGKICVFPDPENERWFEEWQELFELSGSLRHQTYVNAGFVVFSACHWFNLLERWWQSCERIFSHATIFDGAAWDTPLSQSDQDALNAVLMSEIPVGAIAFQPKERYIFRQGDNFESVQISDVEKLTCISRGGPALLLHWCMGPKPWESWLTVKRNDAYVQLLRRLLVGKDVAIKVPPKELPIWLKPGALGHVSFYGFSVYNLAKPNIFSAKLRARRILKKTIARLH